MREPCKTTRPVGEKFRRLRADLRAAQARGESAVGPMYRHMDRAEREQFIAARRPDRS